MSDVRTTTALIEAISAVARWYPATAQPPRTVVSQTRLAHASKPPMPTDVLSLRRDTVDTLTSWALLVAEERDLRPQLAAGHVAGLTSMLGAHAEWLAGHEAGQDALHELGRIATRLEDVAKQRRPSRVRIGTCPESDAEGDPCPGRLVATVRRDDALLPSAIRCSEDRLHQWEPHDWPGLGRTLGRAPMLETG